MMVTATSHASGELSGWSRNWPAPAKLNLMLHITGRRAAGPLQGYHELQTVFQLLNWADVLHFRPRADGLINRLSGPAGVAADDDLTVRAARLMQQHSTEKLGVDIRIDKRLPIGGGLGGGSSDAATVLVALNKLWQLGLATDDLAELGLQLGADVPVFVRGQNAWAEGVGEKIQPIELPERWFLVLKPACHVNTARVFSAGELTRDTPISTIRAFTEQGGRNDCETVVRRLYPEVSQVFEILGEVAPLRLTGTGACIFSGYADLPKAMRALQQMRSLLPQLYAVVVRGCSSAAKSPLLQRLEHEATDETPA